MRTLANVKTASDNFLGPKTIPVFGPVFQSLDVKLKVLKKNDNKEFRLVQNPTIGQANFNQFIRCKNQLVNPAGNFATEENLSPVLIPTMCEDMDEQLNLIHKVVDVVNRANRMICVTLLR